MTFPPGRARLVTKPRLTGSSPARIRSGLSWLPPWPQSRSDAAAVTDHAVGLPGRPPAPADDRAGSRPNGIRSLRSRLRHSRSLRPCEMRRSGPSGSSGRSGSARRSRRIRSACCARAASGHAAAAPPSSVMNSRRCSGRDVRFIARPPHRTVRAAFPHTAPTSGV